MRPLLACATVLTLCTVAAPATAATSKVVYGYAWADGTSTLRVTPVTATAHGKRYRLERLPGSKELRLDYSAADFRRVTVACDLKETEGKVALDAKGLGKTRCTPKDLAFVLSLGPAPVRIDYADGKAVKVSEFLPDGSSTRSATGTVKRVDDRTVQFGGLRLAYTWMLGFNRVTARCADPWLHGKPVHADKHGLGTKACTDKDFTRALKPLANPVRVRADYDPLSNQLLNVWEVFGDA